MASWKSVLRIGCGTIVAIPVLVCAGTGLYGVTLDGAVALEATEVVAPPPADLYDLLDDAAGIARWWERAAEAGGAPPGMMQVVPVAGTPTEGPGCAVDFKMGGFTSETWTILAVYPGNKVVYDVDFKMMRVERTVALTPDEGGGTRITWTETGRIVNPWMRLMSAGMGDGGVEENFRGAMRALAAATGDG